MRENDKAFPPPRRIEWACGLLGPISVSSACATLSEARLRLKDPTAWQHDLAFYMSEDDVTGQAEASEPLLETGSKAATDVPLEVFSVGCRGLVMPISLR